MVIDFPDFPSEIFITISSVLFRMDVHQIMHPVSGSKIQTKKPGKGCNWDCSVKFAKTFYFFAIAFYCNYLALRLNWLSLKIYSSREIIEKLTVLKEFHQPRWG